MNLFVLGATGNTGRHIVDLALERGHSVTAFVRSPDKITRRDKALTVVAGDPLRVDPLARALRGHDAVLSALGPPPREAFRPNTLLSEGAATAFAAMKTAGVERLAIVSAAMLFPEKGLQFVFIRWLLKHHVRDLLAMEAVVQATALDWTIARPPRLTKSADAGLPKRARRAPRPCLRGVVPRDGRVPRRLRRATHACARDRRPRSAGEKPMSLFTLAISIHAIVAVAGVGLLGAIRIAAAFGRRGGLDASREGALLAILLRYTLWSIGIVGLSGVLLEIAAGGAFHSAPWFRASVGLYLLLGFSHARARRAQRNGLVPGADPETTLAALRKIERWGWAMCAAASGIALLMVVRPSP